MNTPTATSTMIEDHHQSLSLLLPRTRSSSSREHRGSNEMLRSVSSSSSCSEKKEYPLTPVQNDTVYNTDEKEAAVTTSPATAIEISLDNSDDNFKYNDDDDDVNDNNAIDNEPMHTWSAVGRKTNEKRLSKSLSMISLSSSSSSVTTSSSSSSSISKHPKRRRRDGVRFAEHMSVRTYSILLGDHPFCEDGWAIELGWEYDSYAGKPLPMTRLTDSRNRGDRQQRYPNEHGEKETNEDECCTKHCNNKPGRGELCPRRSQEDRKRLLLEVAGCSEKELDRRSLRNYILRR